MGVYTSINDGTAYFQPTIYTGNGNNGKVITNYGNSNLQPDWLWGKCRNLTQNHNVFDTSRGLSSRLTADQTAAANSDSTTITAVSSDGFTLGSSNNLNNADDDFVVWQWKANGGTTSSNSSGSITSTVQANTTAGFSIVTYTGTGSNATIGHGLGTAPQTVLIKKYGTGGSNRAWIMYMEVLGNTKALFLNDSDPEYTLTDAFNSTSPTSTTFSIGTNGRCNDSGEAYVAYCFAAKQGFSRFGRYEGNGNASGQFIYTGFKPAFVMIKKTSGAAGWIMLDSQRGSTFSNLTAHNVLNRFLNSNSNDAETTNQTPADFLSNGFKLRNTDGSWNGTGPAQYIYWAFARNSFVSSAGVPTTAR
tara:strand:+ start:65 stop:1147 length:1083 start_codon:yes stop_codon:yes gene_type:complete